MIAKELITNPKIANNVCLRFILWGSFLFKNKMIIIKPPNNTLSSRAKTAKIKKRYVSGFDPFSNKKNTDAKRKKADKKSGVDSLAVLITGSHDIKIAHKTIANTLCKYLSDQYNNNRPESIYAIMLGNNVARVRLIPIL
ncbi:MAG: hypothetical protein JST82_16715 [Bacteroidetes bacterium]|nr:hypothetical protein [Bacteroidota bacterium]